MNSIKMVSRPVLDDGVQEGFFRMDVVGAHHVGMMPVWTSIPGGLYLDNVSVWVLLEFHDVADYLEVDRLVDELLRLEPNMVRSTVDLPKGLEINVEHPNGTTSLISSLGFWDGQTKILKMAFPIHLVWENVMSWAALDKLIFERSYGFSWHLHPTPEGQHPWYSSEDHYEPGFRPIPEGIKYHMEVYGTSEGCKLQADISVEEALNFSYQE